MDSDEEVQKQLNHMVNFIYREAEEKAAEINAKAHEEFTIEKQRIVTEEKLKISKEFDRKEKQAEVKKKIAYSNELNQSRLRILKSRDEGIQTIFSSAHQKLAEITKDKKQYKELLHKLILQGLIKLDEKEVQVVYREEDKKLVEEVLQPVVEEYHQKTGKTVKLNMETSVFLPPGPDKAKIEGETCSPLKMQFFLILSNSSGGIVLSCNQGKIICSNTLDARLSMAFEQQLPLIRKMLFGKSTTRIHYD